LLGLFGGLYLTLHLAVTGGYLLWLYRHRPTAYATVRATLLVATLISLVIFALYPTAPPRIAGVGISDTVSGAHFNLNRGLVSSLYNPFAAMPSMHFGYALIVGASLARVAGPRIVRLAGLVCPALVLLIILTTGNHFVFDAIAGALVVGVAALTARALTPAVATPDLPRSGRCASPSRMARRHRMTPPHDAPHPSHPSTHETKGKDMNATRIRATVKPERVADVEAAAEKTFAAIAEATNLTAIMIAERIFGRAYSS
jgi:hypothetical protein